MLRELLAGLILFSLLTIMWVPDVAGQRIAETQKDFLKSYYAELEKK